MAKIPIGDKLSLPPVPFSRGIKVGNTVYLAGVTAIDSKGNLVGGGSSPSAEAQARQCYQNIKALLEDAGASMDDVVMSRTYVTSRKHMSVINDVRSQYYTKLAPCDTAVVVGLLREGALMEIEVMAIVEDE